MLKKFLGAAAVALFFTALPLTLQKPADASMPTLAFSEACAESGSCCPSQGDFCLVGGEVVPGMRSSNGESCNKPGT